MATETQKESVASDPALRRYDDLYPVDHPKDGAIALANSFVRGEATKGQYDMPYQ